MAYMSVMDAFIGLLAQTFSVLKNMPGGKNVIV
jgi:hypothetical protein